MRVTARGSKSSHLERRVISGMITDVAVLARIDPHWDGSLFTSSYVNTIGTWCIRYFRKYNKAPGEQIVTIFSSWQEQRERDPGTIKLIDALLRRLSEEWERAEPATSEYIIDLSRELFNRNRLLRLAENVQDAIEAGHDDQALAEATKWNSIELGMGTGIDVFQDADAIRRAFESESETLIKYPGDLGKFFGGAFQRGGFVSLMGATGRGKSFWLMDLGYRGMLQRHKVAMFQIGDMTEAQVYRRFLSRVSRRPWRPATIRYPVDMLRTPDGYRLQHQEREFKEPLDYADAKAAVDKMLQKQMKSQRSYMKLSVHSAGSLSVSGIADTLNNWDRLGWGVPDICVIDYADLLDRPAGFEPGRDSINENWRALRALSQELHCLVVTGTQSDAKSYDATVMRRGNFTDDRRKNDHATAIFGITATDTDQEDGIFRVNCVKNRNEAYQESSCVYVASCLGLANPAVLSKF